MQIFFTAVKSAEERASHVVWISIAPTPRSALRNEIPLSSTTKQKWLALLLEVNPLFPASRTQTLPPAGPCEAYCSQQLARLLEFSTFEHHAHQGIGGRRAGSSDDATAGSGGHKCCSLSDEGQEQCNRELHGADWDVRCGDG